MYLMVATRPDLAAAVGVLSQFAADRVRRIGKLSSAYCDILRQRKRMDFSFQVAALQSYLGIQMQTGLETLSLAEAQAAMCSC